MDKLSGRLTKGHMKRLAPELKITSEEVNKTSVKHCPDVMFTQNADPAKSQDKVLTQKANYEILTNWMNNQNSREDAYVLMKDALERAGLKLFVKEVLYYGPLPLSHELLKGVLTDDHLQQPL